MFPFTATIRFGLSGRPKQSVNCVLTQGRKQPVANLLNKNSLLILHLCIYKKKN